MSSSRSIPESAVKTWDEIKKDIDSLIASKKSNMGETSTPSIDKTSLASKARTSSPPPGSVHVFTKIDGETVYIATVNKAKFAQTSYIAATQLLLHDDKGQPMGHCSSRHAVTVKKLDVPAARVLLEWIEGNILTNPKPLTFEDLGAIPNFAAGCKIHHACNVLGINREIRGDLLRNKIFAHIRNIKKMTCEEFACVMENLAFDKGLTGVMKTSLAYHTVKGWVDADELEKLMSFVVAHDRAKGTNCQDLQNEMVTREAEAQATVDEQTRKFEAKEAEDNAVFVAKSEAPAPLVLLPAPKKAPLQKPSKTSSVPSAPKLPEGEGIQWTEAEVEKKAVKKPFGTVGGAVGKIRTAAQADAERREAEEEAAAQARKGVEKVKRAPVMWQGASFSSMLKK